MSKRIVSVDIDSLRERKHVMAVAGGEAKPLSIRGALKGGFIDILVTDYKTALAVIEE